MAQIDPKDEEMKQASKEMSTGEFEDFAFTEAIREGLQTECIGRNEVFDTLRTCSFESKIRGKIS